MKIKNIFSPALFCCATAAFAQMPMQMNEQDMQQMMGAMQEVQACFEKVDRQAMDALQQRSMQFSSELQNLCKTGKRVEAENRAMAFYKEMMADKTVKQVQGCAEKVPASLQALAKAPLDYSQFEKQKDQHVCDHMAAMSR